MECRDIGFSEKERRLWVPRNKKVFQITAVNEDICEMYSKVFYKTSNAIRGRN